MDEKQSRALGLPPTVKLSELASNATPTLEQTDLSHLTAKERVALLNKQRIQATLHKESPKNTSTIDPDVEFDDGWAELPVHLIRCYEYNPRKHTNESFAEMKDSIRVNGVLQTISVTKRPGESHYITFSGGNTRLQIVQELYKETLETKFANLKVIVKRWRGEAAVLLAHMAENTQRNDMTFWDKANGTLRIKAQLEQENGKKLSHREFEQSLKQSGISIDLRSISTYKFAIERLSIIGKHLSQTSMRDIQPQINLLLTLNATLSEASSEDQFFSAIVDPVSQAYHEQIEASQDSEDVISFKSADFVHQLQKKLAQVLDYSHADVKKMLIMLERFKGDELTKERLMAVIKPAKDNNQAIEITPKLVVTDSTYDATNPQSMDSDSVTPKAKEAVAESEPETHTTATKFFETEITHPIEDDFSWGNEPLDAESVTANKKETETVNDQPTDAKLKKLVGQLISVAGISNCIVEAPDMPLGYYLGFDPEGPLDIQDNPKDMQAAWWIVSAATRQFDIDICRQYLPKNDPWRPLVLDELTDDSQSLAEMELHLDNNIGLSSSALDIDWFLIPNNKVAALGLEVMMLLRQLGITVEKRTW